ncbi:PIN domain-containing protein [Ornithinibacillus californiensis]|uniref:PIN domain-containing protein n=1 Tax=Ornithinibacillus californiensis TaxID=161536 RepID=UPI00064DBF4C|nr:PIN domain-containing protein [Ornithinibacillus californiensis]
MLLALIIGFLADAFELTGKNPAIIYILTVILLANYYRVKRPSLITSGKAGWLSALVTGLGQIYAQKKVLGILLVLLHFIVYILAAQLESTPLVLSWVALTVLSVIHANITASKVNDTMAKKALQRLAVLKYRNLMSTLKSGVAIVPDTNILMHEQLMLVSAFRDSNLKLYISKQVMKELDGLKNNDKPGVRKSAQLGFDLLEMYQEAGRVKFVEVPDFNFLKKHHLTGGPDEKIIGSCLKLIEQKIPVVFVSNDKGARILARNSDMPTLSV